jgi:AcrR family transcriptional regulator
LLAAAMVVFADQGFGRATLQDVADRAGVTKGALYHYFDSKNQLFIELVRDQLGGLIAAGAARVEAADPSLSRRALLEDHLHGMWETMQEPGLLRLTQLIMTEMPQFPELGREFVREFVAPSRQTMRRILQRDETTPALSDPEMETLVAVLPSMVLGVALNQMRFSELDPLPLATDEVGRVVIRTLLDGLAPEAR